MLDILVSSWLVIQFYLCFWRDRPNFNVPAVFHHHILCILILPLFFVTKIGFVVVTELPFSVSVDVILVMLPEASDVIDSCFNSENFDAKFLTDFDSS